MFISNISNLLCILFICIIIDKTYTFENDERVINDEIVMEPYRIDLSPSLIDRYLSKEKMINVELPKLYKHHGFESPENYLSWIRKAQQPVEYSRGKRFWLFAKKVDSDMNVGLIPNTNTQQSSLTQGLWRSGIVGRRRRR